MATLEEPVAIGVDDQSIDGTFVTPGTLLPGVLFVHGWGGSQEQYLARARAVAGIGCICLTFDLRGHAHTRSLYESVSRDVNLRDLVAAYDHLASRHHVDPSGIAVIGSSYGGYLAAILTTMRPVRWLGLRAPALYRDVGWDLPKLRLHVEQDLPRYRSQIIPADENRALRAVRDFDGDMLLVQSEHDDIIPASVLSSYRAAALSSRSLTYRCLKGADHGLSEQRDQQAYTTVLVDWLQEMVSQSRRGTVTSPPVDPTIAPETAPTTIAGQQA